MKYFRGNMAQNVGLLPCASLLSKVLLFWLQFLLMPAHRCFLHFTHFIIVLSRKVGLMQAALLYSKKSNSFMRMLFENTVHLHRTVF